MKIYDFIKKKRLEFLKAKLNLLKNTYSEKRFTTVERYDMGY